MFCSALDRCLRRHGIFNLKQLIPIEETVTTPRKSFKLYEPGFIHVDLNYLPQMPQEKSGFG